MVISAVVIGTAVAATAVAAGASAAAGEKARKGAFQRGRQMQRNSERQAEYTDMYTERRDMYGMQSESMFDQARASQQPFDDLVYDRSAFGRQFYEQLAQESVQQGGMNAMEKRALNDALQVGRRNAAITGGAGGSFQLAAGEAMSRSADMSAARDFDRLYQLAFGPGIGSSQIAQMELGRSRDLDRLSQIEGQYAANSRQAELTWLDKKAAARQQAANVQAQTINSVGQTVASGIQGVGNAYAMGGMGSVGGGGPAGGGGFSTTFNSNGYAGTADWAG